MKIQPSDRSGYARFLRLIVPYRRRFVLAVAISALATATNLCLPYLIKPLVDVGIGTRNIGVIAYLALAVGGIYCISEALGWLRYGLEQSMKLKVNFDLHTQVFGRLQQLSLSWFQEHSTAGHLFRIDHDITIVADLVIGIVPHAALTIIEGVSLAVIIFALNWKLALLTAALSPGFFLPVYFFSRHMRQPYERSVQAQEEVFRRAQELFSHMYAVKAWGAEAKGARHFLRGLVLQARTAIAVIRKEIAVGFSSQVCSKFFAGLICLAGVYLVFRQELSLGGLAAIAGYLLQAVALQSQATGLWESVLAGRVSSERLADILDAPPASLERPGARQVTFDKGDIVFSGVSFGYASGSHVLKDLSFSIAGGQHAALVGPSGVGKTTILNLLLRLYGPWEGLIAIDGRDIRDVAKRSLNRQIAVALQEHFLWDDTIENNILYCAGRVTEEAMRRAVVAAGVDEFVSGLAQGYRSVIGENACRLSEGQKQKIALARALALGPKILILDEAMSSIDSAGEARILGAIRSLYPAMTVIVVSHRFSAVRSCDRVYYLQGPQKLIGSPAAELLRDNREFRMLFRGQVEGELSREIKE